MTTGQKKFIIQIMINFLISAIWAIYLLEFLIIKFTVASQSQSSLPTTIRFKMLLVVLVLFHFITYAFYIGKFGTFEDNALIYPFLFLVGLLLMLGGLILSGIAYYQQKKIDLLSLELPAGIFRKTRWPIHLGLIALWLGATLVYNNWTGFFTGIVFLWPVIYFQIKTEEKNFAKIAEEKGLGEKYQNYIKNSGLIFPKFK